MKKIKKILSIAFVILLVSFFISCFSTNNDEQYDKFKAAEKGLSNYELITYPGHPIVGDTQLFAHEFYYNYKDRVIFKDDLEYGAHKLNASYRSDKKDVIVDMGEKYGSDDECFDSIVLHFDKYISLDKALEIGKEYLPQCFNSENYYLEYSLIKTDIYEDEESIYEYVIHYEKFEREQDPNVRPKKTEYDDYPSWIQIKTSASYENNKNNKFAYVSVRTSHAYFGVHNYGFVYNREDSRNKEKIIEWHYDYLTNNE